jgi:branched-chain amino acid transport system ATP-binding protein
MGIGLVPQGRRIFPSLSVKENIVIAERTRGKSNPWTLEKIYDMFPVLKKRSAIKGTLLSGGEQQMLAIARALMANPDLLLMDEPSEGLSPIVVTELGNTLVDLKKSGLSIVIVEQNLPLALKVADEAYIITAGQIVYSSTTIELAKNEEIKEKYIGVSGRSNYDHMKTKDGKWKMGL